MCFDQQDAFIISWWTPSAVHRDTVRIWFRGTLFNRSDVATRFGLAPESGPEAIITHAFLRWGDDCADLLRGDFAFALHDSTRKMALAVRSPDGSIPLYYSMQEASLVLGGDIQTVSTALEDRSGIDQFSLASWIHDSIIAPGDTFLADVKRLPPGHLLTARQGKSEVRRYWRPEELPEQVYSSSEEAWEGFREVLSQAVQQRLPACGPIGVHASGGLDSGSIAAWASRFSNTPPHCFSWNPPPGPDTSEEIENQLLRSTERHLQTQIHYCPTTAKDILTILQADGLIHPWLLCPTILHERTVQREASQRGIAHLLSGWGGDELASFSYGAVLRQNLLRTLQWKRYWQIRRPGIRSHASDGIRAIFPAWGRRRPNILPTGISPEQFQKSTYLNPDLKQSLRITDKKPAEPAHRLIQMVRYQRGHLAGRIEAYADSGRELGITYHYPLLDQAVMEFAMRLPLKMAVHSEWNRWPFRKTVEPVLPADITWNRIKSDPLRFASALQPMREALKEVGSLLRQRSTQPGRISFIDYPKLLRDLEPDSLEKRKRFGGLVRALIILDF